MAEQLTEADTTDSSKHSSTRCSCESSQESDESSELDEKERDDSTRESIGVSPYMYEPEAEDSTSQLTPLDLKLSLQVEAVLLIQIGKY